MAQQESHGGFWPDWRHNRLFALLVGILLVYLSVFVAFLIKNEARKYDSIGKAPAERRTVSIDGSGKVIGAPDIATLDLGFTAIASDVQTALKTNNEKMNRLNEALKKQGISGADIQTSRYNVYPNYNYTQPIQEVTGYTADQGVTVKIRDLSKVSTVLQVAGEIGANNVSGLNFTIAKPEALQADAREKAIADAKAKAGVLAKQLGLRFVKLVNFSESGYTPIPYQYAREGYGGGGVPAPAVEPGSLEINSNVTLTYEIE